MTFSNVTHQDFVVVEVEVMLSSLNNNGSDFDSKVEYLEGIRIESRGSAIPMNTDRSQEMSVNNQRVSMAKLPRKMNRKRAKHLLW